MPKFLLILRGDPKVWQHQDADSIQDLVGRFEAWAGQLMASGRILDGKKLADGEGRVLSRHQDAVRITDGPYGESKEIVGGFHVIDADDYEHAVRLCQEHPELSLQGTVEIRRLDAMGS